VHKYVDTSYQNLVDELFKEARRRPRRAVCSSVLAGEFSLWSA
jgi:hypothetical protein